MSVKETYGVHRLCAAESGGSLDKGLYPVSNRPPTRGAQLEFLCEVGLQVLAGDAALYSQECR